MRDMGWCNDVNSENYNKLVKINFLLMKNFTDEIINMIFLFL